MAELTKVMIDWAVAAMAPGGRLVETRGLREGGAPWLLRVQAPDKMVEAVLRPGGPSSNATHRHAIEIAALSCAERHGVPAPRVIAIDADGTAAGELATLVSVVPGHSRIPEQASSARLLALGAGIAILHGIEISPSADLPPRSRSLPDVDFAAMRRETPGATFLRDVEAAVAAMPAPVGRTALVHGDLWQGNTMWIDTTMVGIVDWDCAGAGHYGIDLGNIRCDAAIMFDVPAAAEVLEGWQRQVGGVADDIAYWDLVAALGTPADMGNWIAPIHDQGRTDLTPAVMNERRDAFARAALTRLNG